MIDTGMIDAGMIDTGHRTKARVNEEIQTLHIAL